MGNVLIDYHHTDLAESLYRLFEDRLGHTVYVPQGYDWFARGVWQFGAGYVGDALAHQFLMPDQPHDPLQPQRTIHRVTFEQAMDMDWAAVIASVPDNEPGYRVFALRHDATFAVEVGNVNQQVLSGNAIILDATGQYPNGIPFMPEFDVDGAFKPRPAQSFGPVMSFVNLMPHLPDYPDLLAFQRAWGSPVRVYGHEGPDGFVVPTAGVGDLMAKASWGYHDKPTGDGYGFVVHYWASIGRPLIGHARYYRGQLAEDLWENLVTCIDLDQIPVADAAALARSIAMTDRLAEMSEAIRSRFLARYDPVADAGRVAKAMGL